MLQIRTEKTATRLSSIALGLAALLFASSVDAQVRPDRSVYLTLRGGATVYGGELDRTGVAAENDGATGWLTRDFGYLAGGELGYQFTRTLGFGLGFNYAAYTNLDSIDPATNAVVNGSDVFPTATAAFRYLAFPGARFSPFATFGAALTLPSLASNDDFPDRPQGYGPLFGAGFDLALSPRISFFLESNFAFIFPDAAVDNLDPGSTTGAGRDGDDVEFDVLGSAGGGLRFNFASGATRADIESLQCPSELNVGQTGSFMAMTNADATQPVETMWQFGDGSTGLGMATTTSYAQAGTYTVTATASNRGGVSTETCLVTVVDPQVPATIAACRATPATANVGQAITFNGTVSGSAPVTISVDYGDGSARGTSLPATRTYAEPGSYTARITVTNAAGSNSCTIPVTVGDTFCATIRELNSANFGFNEATLTAAGRARLDENIEILRRCPEICVTINGYTDNEERDMQRLSQRRADAVRDYYVSQGIDASRLRAVGRGQDPNANSKEDPGPGDSRARRVDSVPSSCANF